MEQKCLVQLESRDAAFADRAAAAGLKVEAGSASAVNWLVTGDADACSSLRRITGVKTALPATTVIVELHEGAPVPESFIEKIGGVVLNRLRNLNVATVAVPVNAVQALASAPGIARIRKDYEFHPNSDSNRRMQP